MWMLPPAGHADCMFPPRPSDRRLFITIAGTFGGLFVSMLLCGAQQTAAGKVGFFLTAAFVLVRVLSPGPVSPSLVAREFDLLRETDLDGNKVVLYPDGTCIISTRKGNLVRWYAEDEPCAQRIMPAQFPVPAAEQRARSYLEARALLMSTGCFLELTVSPGAAREFASGLLASGARFSLTGFPLKATITPCRGSEVSVSNDAIVDEDRFVPHDMVSLGLDALRAYSDQA